jgi:hypothetical protein
VKKKNELLQHACFLVLMRCKQKHLSRGGEHQRPGENIVITIRRLWMIFERENKERENCIASPLCIKNVYYMILATPLFMNDSSLCARDTQEVASIFMNF